MSNEKKIQIYDTTLRDGTQREGISLSCDDKLRIARCLDELGVTFIEGGWPGSNPKDVEFFDRARAISWNVAQIVAFGSTRRSNCAPQEDENLRALLAADTQFCTVVGKTSKMHVREVLRTSLDENLLMIEESLAYLTSHGRRVMYDAEHFFDAYKSDPVYAEQTLAAAVRGGAEILVLCDTNGGSMPEEVFDIVQSVIRKVDHPLGIHAHNDSDCAVANSLAAVRAGAIQIQGTINGYGERCGNANLCTIIPNLEMKLDMQALPKGNLPKLTEVSRYVSEIANLIPDEHTAYVGQSAFAHKGGIHVAAMRRNSDAYQHIDPTSVGNRTRVVVSELSGRSNLLSKAEELGLEYTDSSTMREVLQQIKSLEAQGFSFEAAEASVALMIQRQSPDYRAPFELIDYVVTVEHRDGRGTLAEAMVKVSVGNEILHTAAEGNGPVNALDLALRKALTPIYSKIQAFKLVDYKVRILNSKDGTAAKTRVLIDTRNSHRLWSTVGASTNIIEASWQALADSIEFGLTAAG
jgi:2-isopropylmalate synthase